MPCPRKNHKPFARANAMKHNAVLHAGTVSLACLREATSHNPKPISRRAAVNAEKSKTTHPRASPLRALRGSA